MQYAAMDDEALIDYLKRHPDDQTGWEELLGRYHRLIWWHIYRSRIPEREQHDLYQEIQFGIYDGLLNRYGGKATVKAYVNGVIRNQMWGYWGQRRGNGTMSQPVNEVSEPVNEGMGLLTHEPMDSYSQDACSTPDLGVDPEQASLNNETADHVRSVLQGLKPKEQKMLLLRYHGCSHDVICSKLNIQSEGASRKYQVKVTNKTFMRCEQLDIGPSDFSAGMQTLELRGEIDEMLRG